MLVPVVNAPEAALVDDLVVIGVPELSQLIDLVRGDWQPEPAAPGLVARRAADLA